MSGRNPSSDDIILALEALGFEIEDEEEDCIIMTDGIYSIHICRDLKDEQAKKLKRGLSKIFDDYEQKIEALTRYEDVDADEFNLDDEDCDYVDEVKRIRAWLKRK